jgi:hypothetical protein
VGLLLGCPEQTHDPNSRAQPANPPSARDHQGVLVGRRLCWVASWLCGNGRGNLETVLGVCRHRLLAFPDSLSTLDGETQMDRWGQDHASNCPKSTSDDIVGSGACDTALTQETLEREAKPEKDVKFPNRSRPSIVSAKAIRKIPNGVRRPT